MLCCVSLFLPCFEWVRCLGCLSAKADWTLACMWYCRKFLAMWSIIYYYVIEHFYNECVRFVALAVYGVVDRCGVDLIVIHLILFLFCECQGDVVGGYFVRYEGNFCFWWRFSLFCECTLDQIEMSCDEAAFLGATRIDG